MSQAKVDQYKQDKANRKKIIAKEKRFHVYRVVATLAVFAAILGWAGTSAYSYYEKNKPAKTYEVSTDAVSDYLNTLSTEE